ncbi:MAG: glycoside hydrolase family 57 [Candidatus Omnitrophica bacterium]|nr:glycoside hydrolase family 57 [Candidatus Omnitrophota bacterium]
MSENFFALGLHMHQPPDNLKLLIDANQWEARQIIHCYERAARFALKYKNKAFLHVGFSGILLEQFQDKQIIQRYRQFIDIPEMLDSYRRAKNIEIIGMGFFHPIFPLIPKEDWQDQLIKGRKIVEDIFGQSPKGFWPSEMAFCMEMIPALKEAGYEYVVVDHVHVKPLDDKKPLDCFKPYIAEYEGKSIAIIPRNRDISNAQESGMNPQWFLGEVASKLSQSPSKEKARLLTTWSDGENGGWFRQLDENAGFFGYFFAPYMDMVLNNYTDIKPIRISDFINKYPPKEKAVVKTGAWNVASTSGYDFSQWNGSESQKRAINELFKVSEKYWKSAAGREVLSKEKKEKLEKARRAILDSETSCYLFWGDAWIPKIYEKIEAAKRLLE